ncbi:DUF7338 family protein [Methylomonas sp. 11b]|uniref:DUF7338 family protein n=1 Tax=Methylomonas sp. 11b TaxID=1168169 RepID=UPI00047E74DD|nr:hypothetical protein [Methylomonas sp. 11b]
MMFLRWFLYFIPHFAVFLARYPAAPLAILFFSSDDKRTLTGWRWLVTIDNDLGGDDDWRNKHIKPGSNPYSFWNRMRWLWKNGGNRFNHERLGMPVDSLFVWMHSQQQANQSFWQRSDGVWQWRATKKVFGRMWTPYIGWALFGAKNGICSFKATFLRLEKID